MSSSWIQSYSPTQEHLWSGRPDTQPAEYFYQCVRCIDLHKQALTELQPQRCAVLGFASDEGIRRNGGRPGAAQGPESFRQALAVLAQHISADFFFYDLGDIVCNNRQLETAQTHLAQLLTEIFKQQLTPLVIGGGHEVAWGHYQAIQQAFPDLNIGIINIDAHFDLRPTTITKGQETGANSGTPFWQIAQLCKKNKRAFNYLCLGIQATANSRSLLQIAQQLAVNYVTADYFHQQNNSHIQTEIDDFLQKVDAVYLTVCLDTFASSIAPGVSAGQVNGLYPYQIFPWLNHILKSKKVISCDIAELSPPNDTNQQTAKLAALLANHMMAQRTISPMIENIKFR